MQNTCLNLAKGDLGNSFQFKNAKCNRINYESFRTICFNWAQGLILGVSLGILLGMIAALRQNTIWDYGSTLIAIIGISIPSFVFATLLQYWLAVNGDLFPVASMERWMDVEYTAFHCISDGTTCN